jgi:hypothetical protein
MSIFGSWVDAPPTHFTESLPYPHVVIDNFFSDSTFSKLVAEFGTPDASWHTYWNPLEKKFALDRFDSRPFTKSIFDTLQSPESVALMSQISGIPDLEKDPYLHGAGLHYHPTGGKLDMHLDYSVHPVTGKERRLNLIVYLNPVWDPVWGGGLELWDAAFKECKQRVLPHGNRAILFQTSDISYHGMPTPITCPPTTGRRSLAIYYVSPLRPGSQHRKKATYRPLPDQPVDERMSKLYAIREERRIEPSDLWEGWDT